MASGIEIGPADQSDAPLFLAATRATFEEHRARDPRSFSDKLLKKAETAHEQAFASLDSDASPLFLVARRDGAAVGYVLLKERIRLCLIYDVWTDPAQRGVGIGSALLEAAQVLATEREWSLCAVVWAGNDASHRLFRSASFLEQKPFLWWLRRRVLAPKSNIYVWEPDR